MALLNITSPAHALRLDVARDNVTTFFARRQAYARALEELSSLTDRELADIGIARWDIKNVARREAAKI